MPFILYALLAVVALSCTTTVKDSGSKKKSQIPTKFTSSDKNNAVVLELFSSEGCSSCPSADDLFGQIIQESEPNQQRIYALKFHVDYWDRLGWKDIYASPAYTERQSQYANIFRNTQVYTPQIIINGRREMVGSAQKKISEAIQDEFNKENEAVVGLKSDLNQENQTLNINYEITNLKENSKLNFALVERKVVHEVKRGENEGRTLTHHHLVRLFNTLTPKTATGTKAMKIPEGLSLNNLLLIVYVQDADNYGIYGANQLIFEN
jgi:hypothetical protein